MGNEGFVRTVQWFNNAYNYCRLETRSHLPQTANDLVSVTLTRPNTTVGIQGSMLCRRELA
jgi:hypothetical protein